MTELIIIVAVFFAIIMLACVWVAGDADRVAEKQRQANKQKTQTNKQRNHWNDGVYWSIYINCANICYVLDYIRR